MTLLPDKVIPVGIIHLIPGVTVVLSTGEFRILRTVVTCDQMRRK